MKLTTTETDARRAAVFVLAVAAGDSDQIAEVFEQCATSGDRLSAVKLSLELAALTARVAEQHLGPQWRSALGSAIVDLELRTEGLSGLPGTIPGQALGPALSLRARS